MPTFNSDAGVAALTKMKEVVDGCMGAEGLTYSIDDSEIGMETGTLAFVHIWASRAANMDDPDKVGLRRRHRLRGLACAQSRQRHPGRIGLD